MFWLRTTVITIAAAAAVVVAAAALSLAPLWTGPALPAGATRLHIETDSSPRFGCPTALLAPVRIAVADDDLVVVTVASGETVSVVWPSGYAAWRTEGRGELVGPYGNVIGRDGDVLDDLGGGSGADERFHVCGAGEGLAGLISVAPWFLLAVSAVLGVILIALPRALLSRHRDGRPPPESAG